MTRGVTITKSVHFGHARRGRRVIREGGKPVPVTPGPVPRLSRLMALAIRMDELVRTGVVADYAELARLGHVTRARITQIMNLLHLAPDIQEEILFLPEGDGGRDTVAERSVRPIAAILDWRKQRRAWIKLKDASRSGAESLTHSATKPRDPGPRHRSEEHPTGSCSGSGDR
jgi:hypothetical protein